jgi:UDP-GlcNAc:undecaprenyl-phosphate GlcNAc-1-phosphate transferase
VSALQITLPLVVAFVVALVTTPMVSRLARALGVVDCPNDRKVSDRPNMPLMGGVAVWCGAAAGLARVLLRFGSAEIPGLRLAGFFVGGSLMLALGFIDDRSGMRATTKLAGQVAVAIFAFYCGFAIESFRLPTTGASFELPMLLSLLVTVVWITGVTNAINLIDGLDGLATGLAAIMAVTLTYICLQAGQTSAVYFGSVLIGGALGFLPFNFPPARIFLGDTGALYLGFSLSLLAIEGYLGGYSRASVLAFLVPLLALAVPLMDTSLSIFRRVRSGRGIMDPDRLHMHHRLLTSEGSQSRAVIFLYILTACFCAIAVSFMRLEDLAIGLVLLAAVVLLTIRLLRNLGAFSEDPSEAVPPEVPPPDDGTPEGEEN